MEETQLYRLIKKATKESILKAFRFARKLDEDAIKLRSEEDRSTYLHLIVNAASDVYKRYEVNLFFYLWILTKRPVTFAVVFVQHYDSPFGHDPCMSMTVKLLCNEGILRS